MKVFGTLALALLAACATVSTQPLGTAPTYVRAVSRDVPNEAAIWIGTWTKDAAAKSRMYRVDTALFDALDGQAIDRDGRVLAMPDMVAGLEDLDFDARGRLWGVSESGTRKYIHWPTKFPFVIAIDTGRLQ